MRTVSLFSGCGGMDLGAIRSGAEIVYANDILPDTELTYKNISLKRASTIGMLPR